MNYRYLLLVLIVCRFGVAHCYSQVVTFKNTTNAAISIAIGFNISPPGENPYIETRGWLRVPSNDYMQLRLEQISKTPGVYYLYARSDDYRYEWSGLGQPMCIMAGNYSPVSRNKDGCSGIIRKGIFFDTNNKTEFVFSTNSSYARRIRNNENLSWAEIITRIITYTDNSRNCENYHFEECGNCKGKGGWPGSLGWEYCLLCEGGEIKICH